VDGAPIEWDTTLAAARVTTTINGKTEPCGRITSSLIVNERLESAGPPMGWQLAKTLVEAGDTSSVPLAARPGERASALD
jgi:hypothetical protein